MPAYNEHETIEQVIAAWHPVVEKVGGESRLIVIDDGSLDDTPAMLHAMAAVHPRLIPLQKENGGHGSAVLYGYRYAIDSGADFIFQTDSDGQTDPGEFWGFWEQRETYDAVLGNRTKRGDGWARKLVENVVCLLVRVIFGVAAPDANAPFRLMRASLVQKYIERLPQNFNLPNIMLTAYFLYYHENVAFSPISFAPRQGGKNSINFKRIFQIGARPCGFLPPAP